MSDNNDKLAYNLVERVIKLYRCKSNIKCSILKNFTGMHMCYIKTNDGIDYFSRINDMYALNNNNLTLPDINEETLPYIFLIHPWLSIFSGIYLSELMTRQLVRARNITYDELKTINPVYVELFSSEAGKLLKQVNCDPYRTDMSLEQLAINFDLLGI
jgi:hypothetical protein